ncbi:DUF4238 domain-containing protein [Amycolatopsis rhizosphaerae]|uniref:DUF4238 domain-containing protein n=1 Tax=Amycolatopsis rhizosphaerae TaxID=2053003 RepID=A0A558BIU0_9PSEU|nr:DUF4238 domain-containing protein [Amycolatopsis rhizosphaerae]TVT36401.1 DUF4238 domain-containing protein [Amycolatopsis rhizosphaerae]
MDKIVYAMDHDDMGVPKLHHYVPQFYLRRFADPSGKLWVWDREKDRIFCTKPGSIAAETNFYFVSMLAEHGHDPLTMERQFADIERDVSAITEQWLGWIRAGEPGEIIPVSEVNREIVSLFLVTQFLRTLDRRSILADFSSSIGYPVDSEDEKRALHVDLLWDEEAVWSYADHLKACVWLFGYNASATSFITSDNPVAFRTLDHRMWLKAGVFNDGSYVTYPLSPDVVLYCYPRKGVFGDERIAKRDCEISPVIFTDELVESDNTAQVFMASRFVISNRAVSDAEREFAKTIGTDICAPQEQTLRPEK